MPYTFASSLPSAPMLKDQFLPLRNHVFYLSSRRPTNPLGADSTSHADCVSSHHPPPSKELPHGGPFQSLVGSHPPASEAFGVTAMTLPSLSPIEFQVLVTVATLVIFAAAFVVILFSAIVGAGLARLLYLGARSCVKTILPNFVPLPAHIGASHRH